MSNQANYYININTFYLYFHQTTLVAIALSLAHEFYTIIHVYTYVVNIDQQ